MYNTFKVVVVCGGSYRRGKASCGDLDVVITHPDGKRYQILGHLGLLWNLHVPTSQGTEDYFLSGCTCYRSSGCRKHCLDLLWILLNLW